MIKLGTNIPTITNELDAVQCATEACELYDEVLRCGYECQELQIVADNIKFARDTIKDHGAKWYLENCDPENTFGAAMGLESLAMKKIDPAVEGIIGTIVDKIVAMFKAIAKWIKNLFSSKKNEVAIKAAEKKLDNAVAANEQVQKDLKQKVEEQKKNPPENAANKVEVDFSQVEVRPLGISSKPEDPDRSWNIRDELHGSVRDGDLVVGMPGITAAEKATAKLVPEFISAISKLEEFVNLVPESYMDLYKLDDKLADASDRFEEAADKLKEDMKSCIDQIRKVSTNVSLNESGEIAVRDLKITAGKLLPLVPVLSCTKTALDNSNKLNDIMVKKIYPLSDRFEKLSDRFRTASAKLNDGGGFLPILMKWLREVRDFVLMTQGVSAIGPKLSAFAEDISYGCREYTNKLMKSNMTIVL